MRRIHADLMILFIALVWGFAFYYQKIAMTAVGPLLFVGLRSIVATVVLIPFALAEGRGKPTLADRDRSLLLRTSVLAAALFFIGATLQQWGLVTATVTNAGFLTGLYVVIVPLIVWSIGRGLPSAAVGAAVVLAFVGTWLLGGGTIGGFSSGDLLVILGAIFWASHVVVVGDGARLDRPVLFNTLQFAGVALLGLGAAAALETIEPSAILRALPSILFVGVLSSALTFTLLAVAMRHTPPSEAAILMSLETVFAALAGALLLGERLSLVGWAGAGLLVAATLFVQLAPARPDRAETTTAAKD